MPLGLLLLLALCLGAAGPSEAITRKQAQAKALAALQPAKVKSPNVVVFRLPSPVRAGQKLGEAGPPTRARRARRLGAKAWLFWADHDYGAKFGHRGTLALVDHRTGKVTTRRTEFWPLVGGKDPVFIKRRGRRDKAFRVYERVQATFPFYGDSGLPPARAAANEIPAGTFADDCLVAVGDRDNFDGDFQNITNYFTSRGMRAFPLAKNSKGAPTGTDLQVWVKSLTRICKDIVIYLYGHAAPGSVITGRRKVKQKDIVNGKVVTVEAEEDALVRANDIESLIKANPNTTFKVIVDSCYSGSFRDELRDAPANLLVAVTSSSSTQSSYGMGTSTYTSGLIEGMDQQESTAAGDQSGTSKAARLIELGHGRTGNTDWAQYLGLTSPPAPVTNMPPLSQTPPPDTTPPPSDGEAPPTIKPIEAQLAAPTTQYSVTVEALPGRGIDYAWSLQPPADDPDCANFSQLSAPRYASWRHGTEDGCSHTTTNHGGVVTVVATVHWPEKKRDWVCTATYNGSETGIGPQPGPCEPRDVP